MSGNVMDLSVKYLIKRGMMLVYSPVLLSSMYRFCRLTSLTGFTHSITQYFNGSSRWEALVFIYSKIGQATTALARQGLQLGRMVANLVEL